MTKNEFIVALADRLRGLPQDDIHTYLENYGELIDDRIEEGISEADAVASLGSVEEIAARILAETPPAAPDGAPAPPPSPRRTIAAWKLALLILTAPVWLSALLAAAIVVFSFLIAAWSVVLSLFASAVALIASAVALVGVGIALLLTGIPASGAFCIGVGLLLGGLTILLFLGGAAVCKGSTAATKAAVHFIRSRFTRKEVVA